LTAPNTWVATKAEITNDMAGTLVEELSSSSAGACHLAKGSS
jgi:hypothetical protein